MRRMVAVVSLVAFGALLAGIVIPITFRENRVVANSRSAPQPRYQRATMEVAQADRAATATTTTSNRFNRGHLSEEFDGDLPIRHRGEREAESLDFVQAPSKPATAAEYIDEVAQSIPRRSSPASKRTASDAALADDDGQSAPLFPGSVPGRVTLIVSPDQQIRIVAENKSVPLSPLAEGSVLVTAEEFTLTPSKEGGSNQLTCMGNVSVRHQNFTAEGTLLAIDKSNLVLEGTAQRPAAIKKLASGTRDLSESPDVGDFQLVARKIIFTLSLDKLQVDSGTTISPTSSGSGTSTAPNRTLPPETPDTAPPVPVPPERKTPPVPLPNPPKTSSRPATSDPFSEDA